MRFKVFWNRVSFPKIFKNCLGLSFRLKGQNRVPEPPTKMTAYKLLFFIKKQDTRNNDQIMTNTQIPKKFGDWLIENYLVLVSWSLVIIIFSVHSSEIP